MPEETGIVLRPLAGTLGAEVSGVDLGGPLDDELVAAIKRAFHEHLVLVFPRQTITPGDQLAFTRLFGPVEPHPLGSRKGIEGHPEVLVFENKEGTPGARNDFWHSDISFSETPPAASVLYGRTITPGCGDTAFCNMYQAYEELSDGMRRMLDGLVGLHTSEPLAERNRSAKSDGLPIAETPPPAEHPVVRTHPETGRKALYANKAHTVRILDMDEAESEALLAEVTEHSVQPEFVYRHKWRLHDLVFWDNRCCMHIAEPPPPEYGRHMHRTTVVGDRPF